MLTLYLKFNKSFFSSENVSYKASKSHLFETCSCTQKKYSLIIFRSVAVKPKVTQIRLISKCLELAMLNFACVLLKCISISDSNSADTATCWQILYFHYLKTVQQTLCCIHLMAHLLYWQHMPSTKVHYKSNLKPFCVIKYRPRV